MEWDEKNFCLMGTTGKGGDGEEPLTVCLWMEFKMTVTGKD